MVPWTHPDPTERKLRKSDALAIQLQSSSQNNPDMYKLAKLAAMHAKEHEKYKTALEEKEPKEYDYEKGQDNTMHRVAVDISTGDSGAEITGVSEVSVEKTSD